MKVRASDRLRMQGFRGDSSTLIDRSADPHLANDHWDTPTCLRSSSSLRLGSRGTVG